MRAILTAFLILIAGFFSGGLLVQGIAVGTGADQEFIVVFAIFAAIYLLCSVAFIATLFFGNVRAAAGVVARVLLVLLVVAVSGLVAIDLLSDPSHGMIAKSWPVIAGLTLPGIVTVLVQWAIVRMRNAPKPQFGRGAGTG